MDNWNSRWNQCKWRKPHTTLNMRRLSITHLTKYKTFMTTSVPCIIKGVRFTVLLLPICLEISCPIKMTQLWLLESTNLWPRSGSGHSNISTHTRPHVMRISNSSRLWRWMVQSGELHVCRLRHSCTEGSVPSMRRQISTMRSLPWHVVIRSRLQTWKISWVLNPNFRCLSL